MVIKYIEGYGYTRVGGEGLTIIGFHAPLLLLYTGNSVDVQKLETANPRLICTYSLYMYA